MSSSPATDLIQPFQIETPGLRGRFVRLGPAFAKILSPHDYPAEVAEILGEATSLAVTLAAALKFDGLFSLQAQGEGPVGLILVNVTSDGKIRGYARFDREKLDARGGPAGGPGAAGAVPRLLGAGHLAFTVDQGQDTDRYQGVVPLEGATMADCAHGYFRNSEQLETAIVLAARGLEQPAAAALMIQRLPQSGKARPAADEAEEAEEAWRNAVILMSSITADELLDPELAPEDVLYRLYHQEGVRVFRKRPVIYSCRCSREKVASTLASFPETELALMKTAAGELVTTCEFCQTNYVFSDSDLAGIATGV